MNAVILAGGRGSRMNSRFIPKPMRRVNGEPILAHQIRDYADAGVKDIFLAEGFRAGMVRLYLGDGRRYGVNLHHINLGLEMPPIQKIKETLQIVDYASEGDVPVFVSTGDILTAGPKHLENILTNHLETGAKVTADLAHHRVDVGEITHDESDVLTGFNYGPKLEIWSGLAVMQSSVHTELPIKGRPLEMLRRAFPSEVRVYHDPEAADAWLHLTTKDDIRHATRELRSRAQRERR